MQGVNSLIDNNEFKEYDDKMSFIKTRIEEFFNIKNINFLLGSGTSCPAIPNMSGLFRKVKEEIDENKNEHMKSELNSIIARIENKENLEDMLGILYSHRIYLKNHPSEIIKSNNCDSLIEILESIIFNNINIDINNKAAASVLKTYKDFYQKIALREKDLSRLNIFTTNNDLFNEYALDSLNIHYINGFGGGIERFFNPAIFNYSYSKRMDTSINKYEPVENLVYLYKIHGSVNWVEDNTNTNTFFKVKEVSIPVKNENNVLIYPTPTKQNKSLGSPYVEMFREFQKKLLIPHSVLFVIGYSFSDEHVNNIIYQALATNSSINIVIMNDITGNNLCTLNDNRIFRIWGHDEEKPIHYFDYIVQNLLPNLDSNRNKYKIPDEIIEFYKNRVK